VEFLALADIVEMKHEELPKVVDLMSLPHSYDESSAYRLLDKFGLKVVCVTRGAKGSMLVDAANRATEHPGYPALVADTIGAGDAFTVMIVHRYLRGATPEEITDSANRVGAWVASRVGATPYPNKGSLIQAAQKWI